MLENLKYQDIETFALITFALMFVCLERLWPKHQNLDIKSHLKLDLMAFVLLILGVNFSRFFVSYLYDHAGLKSLGLIVSTVSWPFILKMCLAQLIADFFLYWIHRGMHNWDILWRTHQFHHSAESLYWFSGFRTSFMHGLIYAFPQVLVGFYLFQFTPLELGLGFSFGVFSNLFTHSNLRVPRWLPLHWVFVTPDFHHPHHSQMGTQNKNFGNIFTIWDRLFGSYVDPKKIRADFKYGLKEKPRVWRMMLGL
jgi:sterol desaturase/sphingolipid hydroxylase (fatty acid hydroxylase superfamily)